MSGSGLIGRIAVQEGMISREQLERATREQARRPDVRLGEILIELGYIDEGELGALLALQARAAKPRPPKRTTPPPVKQPVPEGVKLATIALKRVAAAQFDNRGPACDDERRKSGDEARGWLLGLLADANQTGASDILMLPNQPVRLRRFDRVHDFTTGPVSASGTERLLMQALGDAHLAELELRGHVTVVFEAPSVGRYRLQVHRERDGLGGCFHRAQIGDVQPSFAELGLPNGVATFTNFPRGLVLITGPRCSGRSTTLSALTHFICEERSDHVLMIQTPPEHRTASRHAVVTQMEVGRHCSDVASALRDAARMDVDVVCIDDLPPEATEAALMAADTDHLVLATLRAPSSTRALETLIDRFAAADRARACRLVADSVRAVLNQRLVPALNHERTEEIGTLLALEVIQLEDDVREAVRGDDLRAIPALVSSGHVRGRLLDTSLKDLARSGRITLDAARAHARHPASFASKAREERP